MIVMPKNIAADLPDDDMHSVIVTWMQQKRIPIPPDFFFSTSKKNQIMKIIPARTITGTTHAIPATSMVKASSTPCAALVISDSQKVWIQSKFPALRERDRRSLVRYLAKISCHSLPAPSDSGAIAAKTATLPQDSDDDDCPNTWPAGFDWPPGNSNTNYNHPYPDPSSHILEQLSLGG